jgi:phosphoglycolate phosphatase-like HAD superfamily hydrolase
MRGHSALHHAKKKLGIFWDVDGTLVDSSDLCRQATCAVLKRNGYSGEVTRDQYHEGAGLITSRRMAWHATGNPDDPIGPALGREFDNMYIDMVTAETVPMFSGVKELIKNISLDDSIGHGVLSNACGAYVRAVCRAHSLESLFSVMYGADDVGAGKPNADGLQACCRAVNVSENLCIYVGDSKNDGLAAKAAGMKSVYVCWGYPFSESTASEFDYRATNSEELCSILDRFIDECKSSYRRGHSIVWDPEVIDNEHAHKMRTDNEYWDGRR